MSTLLAYLDSQITELEKKGDINRYQIITIKRKDYYKLSSGKSGDFVMKNPYSLEVRAIFDNFGISEIYKIAGYTLFIKII